MESVRNGEPNLLERNEPIFFLEESQGSETSSYHLLSKCYVPGTVLGTLLVLALQQPYELGEAIPILQVRN